MYECAGQRNAEKYLQTCKKEFLSVVKVSTKRLTDNAYFQVYSVRRRLPNQALDIISFNSHNN